MTEKSAMKKYFVMTKEERQALMYFNACWHSGGTTAGILLEISVATPLPCWEIENQVLQLDFFDSPNYVAIYYDEETRRINTDGIGRRFGVFCPSLYKKGKRVYESRVGIL